MTFLQRTRLRVLAVLVGVALSALAVISLTTVPAWPIVGVAVAAAAVCVHNLAHRFSSTICYTCGHDLRGLPRGEHGTICPTCGSVAHLPEKPDKAGTKHSENA